MHSQGLVHVHVSDWMIKEVADVDVEACLRDRDLLHWKQCCGELTEFGKQRCSGDQFLWVSIFILRMQFRLIPLVNLAQPLRDTDPAYPDKA